MDRTRLVLDRLALGPATLADLRAALPADDGDRRALPSMGERDPFGTPGEVRAELGDAAYVTAVKGEHTIRATGPLVDAARAFVESLR